MLPMLVCAATFGVSYGGRLATISWADGGSLIWPYLRYRSIVGGAGGAYPEETCPDCDDLDLRLFSGSRPFSNCASLSPNGRD